MTLSWDQYTDVVVIGSGAAGLSAALEAGRTGASVAVFEKMKVTGGNTRISDGCLSAPNNFLQKRFGVEDSPELFSEDMMKAGLGLNGPELVSVFAENASDAVDWTREMGVQYLDRLDRFGGHSVARGVTIRNNAGVDIIKAQVETLRRMGITIKTRCALEELITDADGTVLGVRIRSGNGASTDAGSGRKHIRARRGVVMATGGFGHDVAFRMRQNPRLDDAVSSTNHKGATAEGLIAGLKIHAMPVHLSWIQLGPWGCADEVGYGGAARFVSYCIYPAGILVDAATGRRIVNEWGDRRQRSDAIFNTGGPCIGVVDSKGAQRDADSLDHCLKTGKVRRFDTIRKLGEAYGIPPGALERTVTDYNRQLQEGATDRFGKPLGRDATAVDAPPFYAARLWPKVHHTSGGLGIDARAQVIDLHGRPIPRLYAAGEVAGGIHGASRLGGCALPECIVFGRIAGREAAMMKPLPDDGDRT